LETIALMRRTKNIVQVALLESLVMQKELFMVAINGINYVISPRMGKQKHVRRILLRQMLNGALVANQNFLLPLIESLLLARNGTENAMPTFKLSFNKVYITT